MVDNPIIDLPVLFTTGMPQPIIKGTVRILRPSEYEKLREGAETLDNQTRLDTLLLTGASYIEGTRLYSHPDWVDGRFVHLPVCAEESQTETARALDQIVEQRR